jgi:hypothetical protein
MQSELLFKKNADSIRTILGLEWEQYIEIFGMTSDEARRFHQNPKDFPLANAMNFCEYFQLDLENIFSDRFDVTAFAKNYFKGPPTLTDSYQLEKNSRIITLINIVNGLEAAGLSWLNELIFRRLQIPKSLLLYPEIEIPVKIIVDYLALVKKYHKDSTAMKSCGHEGIVNLNKKFSFLKNDSKLNYEFYDDFFTQQIKNFDKSFDYQVVRCDGVNIQVKCTLREELKDLYSSHNLSNLSFLDYKSGIGSGLSTLFGQESSETTIIKEASESGYDLIEIELPKPRSSSLLYLH